MIKAKGRLCSGTNRKTRAARGVGDGSHWGVRTARDWGPSVAAPHSGGRGDCPREMLCWTKGDHRPGGGPMEPI